MPCPGQPELAYKGEKFSSRDRLTSLLYIDKSIPSDNMSVNPVERGQVCQGIERDAHLSTLVPWMMGGATSSFACTLAASWALHSSEGVQERA